MGSVSTEKARSLRHVLAEAMALAQTAGEDEVEMFLELSLQALLIRPAALRRPAAQAAHAAGQPDTVLHR